MYVYVVHITYLYENRSVLNSVSKMIVLLVFSILLVFLIRIFSVFQPVHEMHGDSDAPTKE